MNICPICTQLKANFFCEINDYKYYFCKLCKTAFLFPQPKKKETESYYINEFKYNVNKKQEMLIRKRSHKILCKIKELNPSGKNLLDIGSGLGILLEEANKLNIQAVGIEPSNDLYFHSKNKKQLNIQKSNLEQYINENKNQKFDFITLIHTIEHLSDPKITLEKISQLLNKNGILFIETPSAESHLFNFEKRNFTFLTPPEHLWVFSIKSFYYLIKSVKEIKINKISTYSYPEHLMGILKKILKRKKVKHSIHYQSKLIDQKDNKRIYKFLFFDKFVAPILTPLLNLFNKGSFIEIYIQK